MNGKPLLSGFAWRVVITLAFLLLIVAGFYTLSLLIQQSGIL